MKIQKSTEIVKIKEENCETKLNFVCGMFGKYSNWNKAYLSFLVVLHCVLTVVSLKLECLRVKQ